MSILSCFATSPQQLATSPFIWQQQCARLGNPSRKLPTAAAVGVLPKEVSATPATPTSTSTSASTAAPTALTESIAMTPSRRNAASNEWVKALRSCLSPSFLSCLGSSRAEPPLSPSLRRALLDTSPCPCADTVPESMREFPPASSTSSNEEMQATSSSETSRIVVEGYPQRPLYREIAYRLYDWNEYLKEEQAKSNEYISVSPLIRQRRRHASRGVRNMWRCKNWNLFCPPLLSSSSSRMTTGTRATTTTAAPATPLLFNHFSRGPAFTSSAFNPLYMGIDPSFQLMVPATELGFEELPDDQLAKLPFPPPSSPNEISKWIHQAGDAGVLRLLGYRQTVGSASAAMTAATTDANGNTNTDTGAQANDSTPQHDDGMMKYWLLPHPQELLNAASLPHHPREAISLAARARSKHAHRGSEQFFGEARGSQQKQNEDSYRILQNMLLTTVWINVHTFGGCEEDEPVLEIRVPSGYGARWKFVNNDIDADANGNTNHQPSSLVLRQRTVQFRGFLEPQMEDGHQKGW
eukprot:CAMPEP_0119569628 /NCGR_PEP_ID=MMETSP1352-20130426/42209_1 /TAXON_ID=265584 /ORGANISM="Stauroneis constricta, Strain CCMP1120" /LENGTH=523 /DNA_ID=CAMNT_0007619209 /DNA_START=252 /DNA_END=1820 /DNA_ORIENTATION=+